MRNMFYVGLMSIIGCLLVVLAASLGSINTSLSLGLGGQKQAVLMSIIGLFGVMCFWGAWGVAQ